MGHKGCVYYEDDTFVRVRGENYQMKAEFMGEVVGDLPGKVEDEVQQYWKLFPHSFCLEKKKKFVHN